MKVLITGGAGFLGLHLAHYFKKRNHQVFLLDIQDFNKDEYSKDFTFHKVDVRDKKNLSKVIKGKNLLIHAAAALPLWKKEDIFSTNVDGTRNVLELAKKHKVKRLIHISSTAVYGVPEKHPILETDELVGVGAYGESKIEAEKICQDYMEQGMNLTVIRPKTFVGTCRLGVFEILFDWIHDGKKIPIVGDGNNKYQLLDVDDLVAAIYLFSQDKKKAYNDFFNIGAKKFSKVKIDLGKLCKFAKNGSKVMPIPASPVKFLLRLLEKMNLSPLYQWVYDTADKDSYVSIAKLERVLKWSPKFSNQDALIKSYKWYLKNYDQVKAKTSGVTHTTGWKQGALGFFKKFL
jgi:nucleoside-diphosphate-sugar epimerase